MNNTLLFSNVLAYSLQIGFLTALAGFAPAALRLTAPRARLIYWHFLLVASLLLPGVQPWRHRAVGGSVQIVTGAVTIEATIGADGKVVDAKVVHSIPMLDQASSAARSKRIRSK